MSVVTKIVICAVGLYICSFVFMVKSIENIPDAIILSAKDHIERFRGVDVASLVVDKKVSVVSSSTVEKTGSHSGIVDASVSTASSPYAYFWIIGGIHEDKPSYKGFLWDVLISVNILRKLGSTADMWLYIRLSPDSKLDTLPAEDLRLLAALGIRLKQLDKPRHESFGQLMYDKFLILNMTDYKRVMYLDADVMPLTNLDYYFHLSDPDYTDVPTLLKPNFIMATRGEPCNGGMFFIEPSARVFEQYQETVLRQHEIAKTLPYPHFDKHNGWGYNFQENNDHWDALNKKGGLWAWYGAHADQGLLYYVTKFIQKDLSIGIGDKVQNFKAVDGQVKPELESAIAGVLAKYQPPLIAYQYSCDKYGTNSTSKASPDEARFMWKCTPPYDSTAHFTGKMKPWQKNIFMQNVGDTYSYRQKAAKNLWFRELNDINDKYKMGLDLWHWNAKHLEELKDSSLGYMPMYSDQADIIEDSTAKDAPDAIAK